MDRYLDLLSEKFPSTEDVITEIINLEAILQLPKGTELFLSDIHGEFPAFDHILRIGSGNLKEKIKDLFSEQMTETDISQFTIFTAYPEYALTTDWYKKQDKSQLIHRLIDLLRFTTVKYTLGQKFEKDCRKNIAISLRNSCISMIVSTGKKTM